MSYTVKIPCLGSVTLGSSVITSTLVLPHPMPDGYRRLPTVADRYRPLQTVTDHPPASPAVPSEAGISHKC